MKLSRLYICKLSILLTLLVGFTNSIFASQNSCDKVFSKVTIAVAEDSLRELARMQLAMQMMAFADRQIIQDKFKNEMVEVLKISKQDPNIIVRYQQIVKEEVRLAQKVKSLSQEKDNDRKRRVEEQHDNIVPIRFVDLYEIDVPSINTSSHIVDVQFTPDGKYLIFSEDNAITVVEFENTKVKNTKTFTAPAGEKFYQFYPLPNSKEIIIRRPDPEDQFSFQSYFDIYNIETMKKTGSIKLESPLSDSNVKISRDSKFVLIKAREFDSGTNKMTHVFYLYDMKLEKIIKKYEGLSTTDNQQYSGYAWLPDSSGFILEMENSFDLFDINSKEIKHSYVKNKTNVNWDLKISPNSKYAIVAPTYPIKSNPVILNAKNMLPIQTLKLSQHGVELNISFDNSTNNFSYTSQFRHIIYDGDTLKPIVVLPKNGPHRDIENFDTLKDIYFKFDNREFIASDLKNQILFREKSSLDQYPGAGAVLSITDPTQSKIIIYTKSYRNKKIIIEVFENRRRVQKK